MSHHIGQGLLGDAVGRGGYLVVDARNLVMFKDTGDAGTLFKIIGEPLQGVHQAEFVQDPGAQPHRQAPHLFDGSVDEVAHGQRPAPPPWGRAFEAGLHPGAIHVQGGEQLPQLIV